jgi:uncharacterized protein
MSKEMMEKIRLLKKKYEPQGFIVLGVFGSWARSEQGSSSDIDILYEITKEFESKYADWDHYLRIEEIRKEIETDLGLSTDLANIGTLDKIGRYFILSEVVYVA